MPALVPVESVIVPYVEEMVVPYLPKYRRQMRDAMSITQTGTFSEITLPETPICADWVEVYVDGRRLINRRHDAVIGGHTHDAYDVQGKKVVFHKAVSGEVTVICDKSLVPKGTGVTIPVKNLQGSSSYRGVAALCEPVALTRPAHGFVTMTADRKGLLYVADPGYSGADTFSLALLTDRGQLSEPICVYLTIRPF